MMLSDDGTCDGVGGGLLGGNRFMATASVPTVRATQAAPVVTRPWGERRVPYFTRRRTSRKSAAHTGRGRDAAKATAQRTRGSHGPGPRRRHDHDAHERRLLLAANVAGDMPTGHSRRKSMNSPQAPSYVWVEPSRFVTGAVWTRMPAATGPPCQGASMKAGEVPAE